MKRTCRDCWFFKVARYKGARTYVCKVVADDFLRADRDFFRHHCCGKFMSKEEGLLTKRYLRKRKIVIGISKFLQFMIVLANVLFFGYLIFRWLK